LSFFFAGAGCLQGGGTELLSLLLLPLTIINPPRNQNFLQSWKLHQKPPNCFFLVRSCENTQKGEDNDKEEETDMSLIRGSHKHQTLKWKLWQQTNKNPELFVVRSCEKNTKKGR
jgi:hypothetical protein